MKTLIILIALLFLGGCGQAVVKDPNGMELFKLNWFLYDFSASKVAYKDWLVEQLEGESKNIKIYTPSGAVITED